MHRRVAKFCHVVATPILNNIHQLQKSRETEQMQFWFCPGKLQACIKDTWFRSIVHYSILALVWPVKCGTNLTQAKVDDNEASRFSLSTGITKLPSIQISLALEESFPNVAPIPLSLVVDIQPMHPVLVRSPIVSNGDKRPKH